MTTKNEPIQWIGDLNDDCYYTDGEIVAHAERIDHNAWYACVYDKGKKEYLFHSSSSDILFLTGEGARNMCELIIEARKAGIVTKFEAEIQDPNSSNRVKVN